MSIVASVNKTWDAWPGFVHVEERHTDSTGMVHFLSYTIASSANLTTKLAENATMLESQLAEAEAEQVLA